MLLYNDALRQAHRLQDEFYALCQNEKYGYQRTAFWSWIKVAETSGLPEFEKCTKPIDTGQI